MTKHPYPSLKSDPELTKTLVDYINKLRSTSENQSNTSMAAADQTKTLQTRKNARDNFTYALLLGVAEAKLHSEEIPGLKIDSDSLWSEATKKCNELSLKIESGMYVSFDSEVSREYSRKFRSLLTSLRHEDNHDLRMKILRGQIEPMSVSQLRSDQLAPRARQE